MTIPVLPFMIPHNMNPEVKIIRPEILEAQQDRFRAAAERFAQEYARGQNQFLTLGRTLWTRITGRQTPHQQIKEATADLTEARLNLAEARARQLAQNTPDDTTYQQVLADGFAQQYRITGQEILGTTQVENSNLGAIDDIYRFNMRAGLLRLVSGAGLVAAASGALNWIQGPNAITATEIGIFLGGTGILDTARQIFLYSFNRSGIAPFTASTASLIRRKASINEGQITGDEIAGADPINIELETRLARETLAQLQIDGINSPDLTNPKDYSDILRQRESLRSRLPRYNDLRELVRSRDTARVSRLTRTLLTTALAAALIYSHASRFEDCGSRTFPQPDTFIQQITGGVTNTSSWRGIAENEWFKRNFGRDFNPKDPQDRIIYDKLYQNDPEGNNQLIEQIVLQSKRKNPQIHSSGRDLLKHGSLSEICPGELDRIFDAITTTR